MAMVTSPLSLSHQDVIKSSIVFMETLRCFHSSLLGARLVIPVMGGKELDLHTVYMEVTKRGGFHKVVDGKKWREISYVFNFPPTATSSSYALKNHYENLLYKFEGFYFFNQKSLFAMPSETMPIESLRCTTAARVLQKSFSNPMQLEQPTQPSASNFPTVMGWLNEKCEHGYLASVKIGTEILHGVLYHPSPELSCDSTVSPSNVVPYEGEVISNGRKRRRRRNGDPERPKSNRSAYNFFFAEKHAELKPFYPNREREVTKIIGQSWNELGPDKRLKYQKIGLEDKERYNRQIKEYEERKKLGQPVGPKMLLGS